MADHLRPFAVVTGTLTGIGFELAKQCIENGFDPVVAADEPAIHEAAAIVKRAGRQRRGCRGGSRDDARIYERAKTQDRPIEALLANARRGLGHGFPDFRRGDAVVDTNIIDLPVASFRPRAAQAGARTNFDHRFECRLRRVGRFKRSTTAQKHFSISFSYALRDELKDNGITVTCLTMMRAEGGVIYRMKNKAQRLGLSAPTSPRGCSRFAHSDVEGSRRAQERRRLAALHHLAAAGALAEVYRYTWLLAALRHKP